MPGVYRSSMSDAQQVVRTPRSFAGLSTRDVKQLASALHETKFASGTVITEPGQPGVGFFLSADGTATVSVDGKPIRVWALMRSLVRRFSARCARRRSGLNRRPSGITFGKPLPNALSGLRGGWHSRQATGASRSKARCFPH